MDDRDIATHSLTWNGSESNESTFYPAISGDGVPHDSVTASRTLVVTIVK